jgi:unsaturated rhamnogalacturonyl hydrolase
MAAYMMLRVGAKIQDQSLVDDALHQFYWHIQYLQNHETGLFYHGYSHITQDHMSGIYWARANAWAAYTMSRVGAYLKEAYLIPEFMEIGGSTEELLSSLKRLQTDNGLWRTVLDYEESYEEVSASAGIAAAMVNRFNPFYIPVIEKAIQGVLDHVGKDGRVWDVSAGTAVMNTVEDYKKITKNYIQGWGQGLTLAFFTAILRLERLRKEFEKR